MKFISHLHQFGLFDKKAGLASGRLHNVIHNSKMQEILLWFHLHPFSVAEMIGIILESEWYQNMIHLKYFKSLKKNSVLSYTSVNVDIHNC